MAGAKSPSTLPPFADNWVGGNIHGLSALAGTLYRYAPEITGVSTALDKKVGQIAGDGGWQGDAAASFTKAWEKDSITGTGLAWQSNRRRSSWTRSRLTSPGSKTRSNRPRTPFAPTVCRSGPTGRSPKSA